MAIFQLILHIQGVLPLMTMLSFGDAIKMF